MSHASTVPPETRATALDFLSRLAAEVSKGIVDLPCFPDVVVRIRQALADPSTTPEKTVTIVGNEPRLAARLLQMANSAAFNPSGRPLTDLRSAITRLGYQVVQSAAVGYAVQQMKYAGPLRSIAKPLSELWKECVSVASVSQAVARRTTVSPDEAFLTGLLHGIGRLYIMVRAMGHAAEFGNDQVFLDMVSDWHAPIGKAVLENWGFAEEMCNAVGEQHDYDRRYIRGGDMQPGGEGRSAGPKVRRKLQIVGAGKGGYPHRFGDAAADRQIGLEDVDRRQHRQVAEIVPREFALTGGDRDVGRGADLGAAGLVVGGHRLLEPGEVAILDEAAEALGLGHREGAMRIAHQPAIGTERGAGRSHPARRVTRIAVDDADPHLDGAEAAGLDIPQQLLADLVRPGPSSRRIGGHRR